MGVRVWNFAGLVLNFLAGHPCVSFCGAYAGRTIKFSLVQGLRFSELIVRILLFEFRFTVFFPLGCGVDS